MRAGTMSREQLVTGSEEAWDEQHDHDHHPYMSLHWADCALPPGPVGSSGEEGEGAGAAHRAHHDGPTE